MSALAKFFFRPHYVVDRTSSEVVAWWESRRLPYNLAVGAAGTFTFFAAHTLFALPPHPHPMPWLPSLGVAGAYGILANVCYTGGWIAELLLRRRFGDVTERVGPALFRYGFAFSVGLTLFPTVLATLDEVFRIVTAIMT